MTYPPFLSISKTKDLGVGEEEYSPTMKGLPCRFQRKFLLKKLEDSFSIFVHIGQPAFRGFCVVFAGPSPPSFQFERAGDAKEELVVGMVPPLAKYF